jgi:hypothetical protein
MMTHLPLAALFLPLLLLSSRWCFGFLLQSKKHNHHHHHHSGQQQQQQHQQHSQDPAGSLLHRRPAGQRPASLLLSTATRTTTSLLVSNAEDGSNNNNNNNNQNPNFINNNFNDMNNPNFDHVMNNFNNNNNNNGMSVNNFKKRRKDTKYSAFSRGRPAEIYHVPPGSTWDPNSMPPPPMPPPPQYYQQGPPPPYPPQQQQYPPMMDPNNIMNAPPPPFDGGVGVGVGAGDPYQPQHLYPPSRRNGQPSPYNNHGYQQHQHHQHQQPYSAQYQNQPFNGHQYNGASQQQQQQQYNGPFQNQQQQQQQQQPYDNNNGYQQQPSPQQQQQQPQGEPEQNQQQQQYTGHQSIKQVPRVIILQNIMSQQSEQEQRERRHSSTFSSFSNGGINAGYGSSYSGGGSWFEEMKKQAKRERDHAHKRDSGSIIDATFEPSSTKALELPESSPPALPNTTSTMEAALTMEAPAEASSSDSIEASSSSSSSSTTTLSSRQAEKNASKNDVKSKKKTLTTTAAAAAVKSATAKPAVSPTTRTTNTTSATTTTTSTSTPAFFAVPETTKTVPPTAAAATTTTTTTTTINSNNRLHVPKQKWSPLTKSALKKPKWSPSRDTIIAAQVPIVEVAQDVPEDVVVDEQLAKIQDEINTIVHQHLASGSNSTEKQVTKAMQALLCTLLAVNNATSSADVDTLLQQEQEEEKIRAMTAHVALASGAPTSIAQAMQRFGSCVAIQKDACRVLYSLLAAAAAQDDNDDIQEGSSSMSIEDVLEDIVETTDGLVACISAMKRHEKDVDMQVAGLQLIGRLWGCNGQTKNLWKKHVAVEAGGIPAVVHAMRQHVKDENVQVHAIHALDTLLFHVYDEDSKSWAWANQAVVEAGSIALVVDAMERHVSHAMLQVYACQFLGTLADASGDNDDDDYRNQIMDARGLTAVVEARRFHKNDARVVAEARYAARVIDLF